MAKQQGLLSGKLFDTVPFFNPSGFDAGRLLLIGAGEAGDLDAEKILGKAARKLNKSELAEATHAAGDLQVKMGINEEE